VTPPAPVALFDHVARALIDRQLPDVNEHWQEGFARQLAETLADAADSYLDTLEERLWQEDLACRATGQRRR
jgi:hypothetical protein